MVKQGSYNVNENGTKDSSFKSFICALLVFLFLCIVLYLILMFSKNSEKDKSLKNEKSESDRLFNPISTSVGAKKNMDTTTLKPIKTADTLTTTTTTTPRYPSPKLKGLSTTEYYVDVRTVHSISHDVSSTENLENGEEGLGKFTYMAQSTPNSIASKEDFSNNYQSSQVMTTENVKLFNNPIEKVQSGSEEISTVETVPSTTKLFSTMSQLNEAEVLRRFTDTFMSSTEINLSRSPIISVNDAMTLDFTANSATPVTSMREESITMENSVSLSTTDEANQGKTVTRTLFMNTFESNTESNLSENSTFSVSDADNFYWTTNSATSIISKESITTENSTGAIQEDKESTRTFTNNFQSSTEIDRSGSSTVLVSGAENFEMTTNTSETVTPSIRKSVMKESSESLLTTESYIHPTDHPSPIKVCNTMTCNRITSQMLNLMNHAADPCQDFYEFACGEQYSNNNFLKQSNFEAILNYATKNDNMFTNFNSFYESCVNHERNFNLTKRMKLMEYFPKDNLTELFVELILTQSMPFFDIGLDINKAQHYSLQITLPGQSSLRTSVVGWSAMEQIRKECLNEQSRLIFNSDINLNDMYTSFKACQMNQFKNFAKNFIDNMQPYMSIQNYNGYIYNDDNLQKLLDLLEMMQDLLPTELEMQEAQVRKNYTLLKIEDLYKMYNAVDWKIILGSLTFDGMFDENNIQVYFSGTINNIFNMLQKYNVSEIVEILGLYAKLQLYENTVIPKDKEHREVYCMELCNQIMPDVVSIIVHNKIMQDKLYTQDQNSIATLFNSLKSQFGKSLQKLTLDEQSKEILQKKLNLIELGLITTIDDNATRDNYKEITLSTNFEKNILQLLGNYRKIIYSLEGKEASAESLLTYFVDPLYTRPTTFYPSKYIVFHPSIFQRTPTDLPNNIILSKIGFLLSEELTKHFSLLELKFMSRQMSSHLVERTNDSLSFLANNTYQFEEKIRQFQINNRILWINQMITDNTAFRLVEDVFDQHENQENLPWIYKSYSVEKIFFIMAAQEYCEKTTALNFMEDVYQTGRLPPPLKIQNIISNSNKFSKIFDCPDGSMHIPDEQKTQFPYVNFPVDYDYYSANHYNDVLSNN